MKKQFIGLFIIIFFSGCMYSYQKTEPLKASQYELVEGWPQLKEGYKLGQPTGLGVDKNQNIYVFHRNGREWTNPFPDSAISLSTILKLDRQSGKILEQWGEGLFIMPHGLTVDQENNIWITDVALHQVFKFNAQKKLLMKLGIEKVADSDSLHFNMPTDVAIAKDGSFYVADGYGNSRIIKFSAEGKYLMEWGRPGTGEGEFNTPHAIDLDSNGNVYVADRENKRIQKFNADGTFIQSWSGNQMEYLYSLTIDKLTQKLFAVDFSFSEDSIIYGSNVFEAKDTGVITLFGRAGAYKGPVSRYHDIVVDKDGNLYICDILENKIQKFKNVL